jgi:hypothetical protein
MVTSASSESDAGLEKWVTSILKGTKNGSEEKVNNLGPML